MNYVFHRLKPVKEFEPGWWKLKWRPIKNGTWNFHWYKILPSSKFCEFKLLIDWNGCHNGWGRGYDGFSVEFIFIRWGFKFWLHYNHYCQEGAPLDTHDESLRLKI